MGKRWFKESGEGVVEGDEQKKRYGDEEREVMGGEDKTGESEMF